MVFAYTVGSRFKSGWAHQKKMRPSSDEWLEGRFVNGRGLSGSESRSFLKPGFNLLQFRHDRNDLNIHDG